LDRKQDLHSRLSLSASAAASQGRHYSGGVAGVCQKRVVLWP